MDWDQEEEAVSEPELTLKTLPKEEHFLPGSAGCAGCAETLAERLALKVLGRNTIVVSVPSCASVLLMYPYPTVTVPLHVSMFASAGAALSGIEAALKARGMAEGVNIVGFVGDGGTFDIGFQSLSAMVERGHNVLFICLDNEAYMNTGGQRSGATPYGASTATTPVGAVQRGKGERKKDVAAIIVDHQAPYVATASVAFPIDYLRKVMKATKIRGPKFIHVHCPCPVGWGFESWRTIEVARLAVQTRMWPLYEVVNGQYRITHIPRRVRPVRDYLRIQRRFRHLTEEEIAHIQRRVDEAWKSLLRRADGAGGELA